MAQRIAIVGGKPTWQKGMEATLEDLGFAATVYPSLQAWRPGRGGRAVIAYLNDEAGIDSLVDFVTEFPHIPVVAVIPDLELASFAAAIRAGASGVVDDASDVDELGAVIGAAIAGRVSAPLPIVRAMAQRIPEAPETAAFVDPDEAEWLRALAQGETVAALAERIGYSERETYRTLGALYQRLGVTNRTEAIIWATRHGLLDSVFR